MSKTSAAIVGVMLTALLAGCASVRETYYLATYDPATHAHNYFRINVSGFSSLSKVKFSVGFYDRQAVERLFGEQVLQREYLESSVDTFDPETGDALADVSDQLAQANAAGKDRAVERLREANATVAGLVMKYEVRLFSAGKLDEFQTYLTRIQEAHELAEGFLANDPPTTEDRTKAANAISKALVGLHAIRVAVDGDVIVRFFDGAGNEMDVASMAQVIFVANDVSRFAEAIRQLVEDEQVQSNVLDIVLGQRMADARRAVAEAATSEEQAVQVNLALEELVANLSAKSTEESPPDANELHKAILDAAATIADGPSEFHSSDDIRDYLEGRKQ